ncbi:unnamed protein product [marine sediment metagenome]|uniref:Uncharacterized protein n=1 Tax=marine sediment metagenome TaxID=412755 RepID=X0URJ9_9ZZZZ
MIESQTRRRINSCRLIAETVTEELRDTYTDAQETDEFNEFESGAVVAAVEAFLTACDALRKLR